MNGAGKQRPILRLGISAADEADDLRLQAALAELAGPALRVSIGTQSQGRLHSLEGNTESDLESICDRLRVEYHLAISVGPLEAILLETIQKEAEAEGKYIRQTGGSGNYGHCKLRIEPNEPGKGYEFINEITGGAVPNRYIKPIGEGIQSAMEQGILTGFPMVDVKVTLWNGSYHEADSNEMAFRFAGSIAFKEAARKAYPVLLEPMMAVEIEAPEERLPAVRKEIYAHRGRVEREEAAELLTKISAIVPLSELLASASGLLAEFRREFAGYEPLRDNGASDENEGGVLANKPNGPRPRIRSAMARWNLEAE